MKQIENNNIELSSKELIDRLSKEISDNFSISEELAQKYILSKTIKSLEDLKNDLLINKEKLSNNEIQELYEFIENKKEKINFLAKNEIKKLKDILVEKNQKLPDSSNLDSDSELIKRIFSQKLIDKAKNPQNISEQIMGASLGIINSGISIINSGYSLGKGIITSIPDLVSIISGRGEIESIKKV